MSLPDIRGKGLSLVLMRGHHLDSRSLEEGGNTVPVKNCLRISVGGNAEMALSNRRVLGRTRIPGAHAPKAVGSRHLAIAQNRNKSKGDLNSV